MANVIVDPRSWAVQQFGKCNFGDRRRNRRFIKVAVQMAARPDGSTPDQTETWSDCKAAYRLFDSEEVTFEEILAPHCRQTRAGSAGGGVKLLINDTTEVDFGRHRKVTGLGPTGNGGGLGFFLHSSLMIDATTKRIEGLAGQRKFYRKPKSKSKPKPHKNSRRRSKDRESLVWGKLIDDMGRPPAGAKWIHVCDRGADDYEVFYHALQQECSFVIRAAKLHRLIYAPDGRKLALNGYLQELPAQGEKRIAVRPSKDFPARVANMEIRFGEIEIPRPRITTAWIREHTPKTPLRLWYVELRETSPPKGVKPLRWVLYTLEPTHSLTDAEIVIGYYEQRPTIEDFHKGLKTGCRLEYRQYETAARLERVTAMTSLLAVRLLQMKTLAREAPDRPAHEVAPRRWVEVLQRVRRKKLDRTMTIHEFIRELAGLGGHLGRKCDGEPGWITLWRGVEKLLLILRGADFVR